MKAFICSMSRQSHNLLTLRVFSTMQREIKLPFAIDTKKASKKIPVLKTIQKQPIIKGQMQIKANDIIKQRKEVIQRPQEDEDEDSIPLQVEDIMTAYEYTQGEIYYKNEKYEKALKMFEELSEMLKFTQQQSQAYVMMQRRVYACLIKMGRPRDAEMVLLNINETVSKVGEGDLGESDRMIAKIELLQHRINNLNLEHSTDRILKSAKELIKDPDLRVLTKNFPDQAAFSHFIIGLAFFLSEKMTYLDIKGQFKYALTKATGNPQLQAAILHNLAVINYCEMSDHNDRILNGEEEDDSNNRMLEDIEKAEAAKALTKKEQMKVRLQVDKEHRMKRYKERQKSLSSRLSQQLRQLNSNFKFSPGNKSKNRVEQSMARRIAQRMDNRSRSLQNKRMKKLGVEQIDEGKMVSREGTQTIQIYDMLKNTKHLAKGVVIRDLLKYGCDPKRIDPSISLPRRTMEGFYQQISDGLLDFDKDSFMNEVLPLMYLSLRYQNIYRRNQESEESESESETKDSDDPFIIITNLDDFLARDQDNQVLSSQLSLSKKSIEFIARCYSQDSKRYKQQSQYWLDYMAQSASEQKTPCMMRRTEALKAATLIDSGKIQEARQILEQLYQEFEDDPQEEERETQVLIYSLLGLIKKHSGSNSKGQPSDYKDQIEGLKLTERAQELSKEIPGGAVMFERRKWLLIPSVTAVDFFSDE